MAAKVPDRFARDAREFVEYLRSVAPQTHPNGDLNLTTTKLDPKRILSFVSASGLTMSDVNEPSGTRHLSRRDLERELTHRGLVFQYIANLAYDTTHMVHSGEALIPQRKDSVWQLPIRESYLMTFLE